MTRTSFDRFLGVAPSWLVWPGSILTLLSLPFFLIDFLVHAMPRITLSSFVDYLAWGYRHLSHLNQIVRVVCSILSSVCFSLIFWALCRHFNDRKSAFLFSLLFATFPMIWMYSHTANSDVVFLSLAVLSLVSLLRIDDHPGGALDVAGILVGMMLSAKITSIPIVPFLFAVRLQKSGVSVRTCNRFVFGVAIGILFACPYFWTDPIRLAKSIGGNVIGRPGEVLGVAGAMWALVVFCPWVLLFLTPFGIAEMRLRRWYVVIAGFVIGLIANLIPTASLPYILERYFLASLFMLTAVSALGVIYIERTPFGKRVPHLLPLILLAAILSNVFQYSRQLYFLSRDQSDTDLAIQSDIEISKKTTLVPLEFFYHTAYMLSSKAVHDWRLRCEVNIVDGKSLRHYFAIRQLSPEIFSRLRSNFDEDQRAFCAQLSVMDAIEGSPSKDLTFFANLEYASRFSILTIEEAVKKFTTGHDLTLIVRERLANLSPTRDYGGTYFRYER